MSATKIIPLLIFICAIAYVKPRTLYNKLIVKKLPISIFLMPIGTFYHALYHVGSLNEAEFLKGLLVYSILSV